MSTLLYPGTRVKFWRSKHFINDKVTPYDTCLREGTVIKWYGRLQTKYGDLTLGPYENLVDICFDEDAPNISEGHIVHV